jgi:hypothetical protein
MLLPWPQNDGAAVDFGPSISVSLGRWWRLGLHRRMLRWDMGE